MIDFDDYDPYLDSFWHGGNVLGEWWIGQPRRSSIAARIVEARCLVGYRGIGHFPFSNGH